MNLATIETLRRAQPVDESPSVSEAGPSTT